MREIKFRAFDFKTNKMHPSFSWSDAGVEYPNQYIHDYYEKDSLAFLYRVGRGGIELMQYTGLNDKNGVEIYEGDIIKAESNTCNYTIEFIEGGFCATVKEHDYPLDINHFYTSKGCLCEVIGNIYENPELLENK